MVAPGLLALDVTVVPFPFVVPFLSVCSFDRGRVFGGSGAGSLCRVLELELVVAMVASDLPALDVTVVPFPFVVPFLSVCCFDRGRVFGGSGAGSLRRLLELELVVAMVASGLLALDVAVVPFPFVVPFLTVCCFDRGRVFGGSGAGSLCRVPEVELVVAMVASDLLALDVAAVPFPFVVPFLSVCCFD
jgi:hypothetical protein